ncbi:hypothetical protein B0H16DRAFT_1338877 [Mycena metata]|uniref:Uncharacterized protein n=1 Tax=Mycena metata TaxID=1033252 RepID=A0AAD7HAZ0_9AGAR|nr:hypothetical protein B0H16DRAFT_1338877 [Mycena metata]
MGSPFATQEDSESLWYEQSTYVSTHLASIGFGIHLVVYAMVTYYTLVLRAAVKSRIWVFWLVFNTVLFAMGTINLACSIRYNENAWVNDRAYPGGPFNYLIEQGSLPFMTLGNVVHSRLVYVRWILWDFAWYIVVPPAMFFVACIVLSVMTAIQLALPNVPFPQLSLAVWIVLMLLPIWLTILIAGRILYHRQTMVNALGPEYATNYTGVSAIVIESALPFTIISIVLLGLFGTKNIAQNLFIPLLVQVECIAPEMIVLRVVLGRSWTATTMSGDGKASELRFAPSGEANGRSMFDFGSGTQSTRSRTDETAGRTRIVFRESHEKEEEKVEDHNPSGSTVNVV